MSNVPPDVEQIASFAWQCIVGNWGFLVVVIPAICYGSYRVGRFVREHEYQGQQIQGQYSQIEQQREEIAKLQHSKGYSKESGTSEPMELSANDLGNAEDGDTPVLKLPKSKRKKK